MEDVFHPLLAILVAGLFAPLLTQLIEKFLVSSNKTLEDKAAAPSIEKTEEQKKAENKRKQKLFAYAVAAQLLLFTMFFFLSKWAYFDENYFMTSERDLIREGIKKDKDYVIPKMTIRVYSENKSGMPVGTDTCAPNPLNYCMMVSISYEIVALREFNNEKIFMEYYQALNAYNVLREPGSEIEHRDKNPQPVICNYDIITTMKKFERKTITTRADFLYAKLPESREFMEEKITDKNWDFFYYPNEEQDVIGEVEFQIISRTLQFNTPAPTDAILMGANKIKTAISTQLLKSKGSCFQFNILTAKVPRLLDKQNVGIRWSWN